MAALYIVVVLCILLFLYIFSAEAFASKREKSKAIFDWFSANAAPSYSNYKKNITGSDVVEYSTIKRLQPETVDDVFAAI